MTLAGIRNSLVQGVLFCLWLVRLKSFSLSFCPTENRIDFASGEPRVSPTTTTESDGGMAKGCWWSGAEVTVFLHSCLATGVWGKHGSPTATRETVPVTTHKVAVAQKQSYVHTKTHRYCWGDAWVFVLQHLNWNLIMSCFQPSSFINLSIISRAEQKEAQGLSVSLFSNHKHSFIRNHWCWKLSEACRSSRNQAAKPWSENKKPMWKLGLGKKNR